MSLYYDEIFNLKRIFIVTIRSLNYVSYYCISFIFPVLFTCNWHINVSFNILLFLSYMLLSLICVFHYY